MNTSRVLSGAAWAVCAALAACAPALDWREMQPADTGMTANFPCKPDAHARRLALAGRSVELVLHACRAAEATFALASAEVGDPAAVAPALQALAQATAANLGAALPAGQAASVPGMTPNPQARRLALNGRLPTGEPAAAATQVFSRGTRVVQATVIGLPDDDPSVQAFFAGLRFAP